MAEINIDQLVDYKTEYSAALKKIHISGQNLTALCPFHDDRNNSFSVDLETGMWHCHAEDTGGNFVSFYAQLNGIDTKEAYKEILNKYGVHEEPEEEKKGLGDFTIEQYSAQKKLPADWLKQACALSDEYDRYNKAKYIKIPYFDESGKEMTHRKRFARKEFRWKKGSGGKIGLYGEWRLPEIRVAGYTVLVEGESDSQSLWYMGISALGVPGASMFKSEHTGRIDNLKLYLHREKDHGGETFMVKVMQGLKDGGFQGETYTFSCGDIPGCKDPSDVFTRYGKEEGAKKILELIKKAKPVDLDAPEDIPVAIQDAPVHLRQPEGWSFSESGISRINDKTYQPELICRTPIILTRRLKRLDTNEEKIEIAFKRDGRWQTGAFPRSTIFTSRSITSLADLGCTITSENAKPVVQFLSALESENFDIIKKVDSTSTFGWQTNHRFIPGCDEGITLDIDPSQKGMAAAYSKTGTFEDWIRTMKSHRERDKFRFILAASFAAPLLKIIDQRIFFVYNWGGSKGGKTAGLKAALSAWGDPEQLMVSFNATQVGLERTAAFYKDLPLGIDERQLAGRNQESLEKIVYMISSGKGKLRGAKAGGLQTTYQWRTVAIATGEEPLSTDTSQTGVSTRALEIYGGPFDKERQAAQMHQDAPKNCGHAGPEFVKRLIQLKEDSVNDWYKRMLDFLNRETEGKSGSHVACVAAVALADAMIDTWFFGQEVEKAPEGNPGTAELTINGGAWRRAEEMAKVIMEEQMSAQDGDVNENAVQFVTDWVASNENQFGTNTVGPCYGMITDSGNTACIFPTILKQALSRAGYSPKKTLKYMADKGMITSRERKDHSGKDYQIPRRFNGRLCKFIEFFIDKAADPEEFSAPDREVAGQTTMNDFKKVAEDDELPFE